MLENAVISCDFYKFRRCGAMILVVNELTQESSKTLPGEGLGGGRTAERLLQH